MDSPTQTTNRIDKGCQTSVPGATGGKTKEQPPGVPANTTSASGPNYEQKTQVQGDIESRTEDGRVFEDGDQATPGGKTKEQPPGVPANTASASGPNYEQKTQVQGDIESRTEDGRVFEDGDQANPSSAKDGKINDRGKNKAGKRSIVGSILNFFHRSEPELTCSKCDVGLGFTRSQFEHPELATELRCQRCRLSNRKHQQFVCTLCHGLFSDPPIIEGFSMEEENMLCRKCFGMDDRGPHK